LAKTLIGNGGIMTEVDRGDWLVPVVVFIILTTVFGLIGVGGYFWNAYTCDSKWKASGMRSEYGYINGCMLEVTPGKWIPSDRYRSID
jgi:hypothetical protein